MLIPREAESVVRRLAEGYPVVAAVTGPRQSSGAPAAGKEIEYRDGRIFAPDHPVIPFIEGDGVGADIWRASRYVLDSAVARRYRGRRGIAWHEVYAGEKAWKIQGEWLPFETIEAIQRYRVALKGPLTTPIGGGIRSFNVTLRQALNLYAVVRPIRYFKGVPSPMRDPHHIDVVIFREHTEDVYSGIEWPQGSTGVERILQVLRELGRLLPEDSGIGIKHVSRAASQRLVRKAISYAVQQRRTDITLVHQGNVMKHTEGAFREWGYEVARDEFSDTTVTEQDLWSLHNGVLPEDKILLKDRLADSMFQQLLLRPAEYQVLATLSLTGDYLADALAAQVGGLGMAPASSEGDGIALFEVTHGTAPKYAGQDKVNPGSLLLSGVMMLRWLGWSEAADSIERALERTIGQGRVTYDLGRQMEGATVLTTSAFAEAIVENLE